VFILVSAKLLFIIGIGMIFHMLLNPWEARVCN